MQLRTLGLKNFRNVTGLCLTLNPGFNFVFGRNAQGKTNLIEAIFYLSHLQSFRTPHLVELIKRGEEGAQINAKIEDQALTSDVEITLAPGSRQVFVNNKRSSRRLAGLIPLILFEPRHIYLFRDSPGSRRDYLSRALVLQDPSFSRRMQDYAKVVWQKNRLLKEGGREDMLAVWNARLVEEGASIVAARLGWFAQMAALLNNEYAGMTQSKEFLRLQYEPASRLFEGIPAEQVLGLSCETIRGLLTERLKARAHEELARREALVGPHRDDFQAYLGGRLLKAFGSQGENRSALIALKLAQLKLFERTFQKTPLFLLDDVASELDEQRCDYLFSYLKGQSTQVFLTTTENRLQGKDFAGHATSFMIENGEIGPVF